MSDSTIIQRSKHFSWTYGHTRDFLKSPDTDAIRQFVDDTSLLGLDLALKREEERVRRPFTRNSVQAFQQHVSELIVSGPVFNRVGSGTYRDRAHQALMVATATKGPRSQGYLDTAFQYGDELMTGLLSQLVEERAELLVEYSRWARNMRTGVADHQLMIAVMEECIDWYSLNVVFASVACTTKDQSWNHHGGLVPDGVLRMYNPWATFMRDGNNG